MEGEISISGKENAWVIQVCRYIPTYLVILGIHIHTQTKISAAALLLLRCSKYWTWKHKGTNDGFCSLLLMVKRWFKYMVLGLEFATREFLEYVFFFLQIWVKNLCGTWYFQDHTVQSYYWSYKMITVSVSTVYQRLQLGI